MAFDRCKRAIAYRTSGRDTWKLKLFYLWILVLQIVALLVNIVISQLADQSAFDTNDHLKEKADATKPLSCTYRPQSGGCQEDEWRVGLRYDHSCDSDSLLVYSRLDNAISIFIGIRICVIIILAFVFSYYAHLPVEQMRKILKSQKGYITRFGQAVSGCALHVGPTLQWFLYMACFISLATKLVLTRTSLCEPSSLDSIQCRGTSAIVSNRMVSRTCFYNRIKNCLYYVANYQSSGRTPESVESCGSDDELTIGPMNFFGGTDIRQCIKFVRKTPPGGSNSEFEYLHFAKREDRPSRNAEITRCVRIAVLDYLRNRAVETSTYVGFAVLPNSTLCKFDVAAKDEVEFTNNFADDDTTKCKTAGAEPKLSWKPLFRAKSPDSYDIAVIPEPPQVTAFCDDFVTWLRPTFVSFTEDCGARACSFFFYRAISLTVLSIITALEMVTGTIASMLTRRDPFILKASQENFTATRKRPFYSMYRLFRSTMP